VVQCQSGSRSSIAASVLLSRGRRQVGISPAGFIGVGRCGARYERSRGSHASHRLRSRAGPDRESQRSCPGPCATSESFRPSRSITVRTCSDVIALASLPKTRPIASDGDAHQRRPARRTSQYAR
jgi:hypothetical protein